MERRKKKRKKRMAERQERNKREREKNLQMRKCIQISYPFIESLSWTIKPPGTSCAKDSKGSLTSILKPPVPFNVARRVQYHRAEHNRIKN